MKALECKNCGGRINPTTLVCEYCGTQYQRDFADVPVQRLVVESYRPEVKTLGATVEVSDFMMRDVPREKIAEFSMKEITRSLAEALAPYIELETMYNPVSMTQIVRGRVRVLEPNFRF